MTAFPWEATMAIGLGRLRLAPAAFWALTPREFAVLASAKGVAPVRPPGRGDLDAMMRAFPDSMETHDGQ